MPVILHDGRSGGIVLAKAEAPAPPRATANVLNVSPYQVHWPNRFVPISSTMRGMRELVPIGKVRAVGVSNFSLKRWRQAEAALGSPVVSNRVSCLRRPWKRSLPGLGQLATSAHYV